jgi:hypothetical protein
LIPEWSEHFLIMACNGCSFKLVQNFSVSFVQPSFYALALIPFVLKPFGQDGCKGDLASFSLFFTASVSAFSLSFCGRSSAASACQ